MRKPNMPAPESMRQAAHDCNNHLACVLGLLTLARRMRPDDEDLPVVLADAESAAHKLSQDILRLFSTKPSTLGT